MNAKINEASLAEKQAHTELMKAHAELMKAQAEQVKEATIELQKKNKG